MNSRVAPAWLLEYGSGRFAAFGLASTLALIDGPEVDFIPGAPQECLGLLRWGEHRLPLLDLAVLDEAVPPVRAGGQVAHALVVAWGRPGEASGLGAIAAPGRVSKIEVSDAQRCDALADSPTIAGLSIAWFEQDARRIAVIDTAKLFCGDYERRPAWSMNRPAATSSTIPADAIASGIEPHTA